jgi:phage terminase large subunit-like protein
VSRVADREAEGRERILAAFESICPNIIGNPYIPHWPTPPQQLFLGAHLKKRDQTRVFECLYGGAAGGGKSDAMLMASAQYAWKHSDYSAICFRRTFMDLALPGALMDRAIEWWGGRSDVHWADKTKTFTFASGAKVTFGYLQHDLDHLRYKGAEFHQTNWDELTDFPLESQYKYVGISRVRRKSDSKIPLRTLGATNPGGPGHAWVRDRFIGDPENGITAPHPYIPARIRDNPHIDQDAYIEGLMDLHPTVREQLLNGDWTARDPGDYFRSEWFGPLLDPETDKWPSGDSVRVRWWDLAASERPDAARTAGVLMARHTSGVRAVEHVRAFRATPGKRDDLIVQVAKSDGYGVTVGLEIEGGSGGPAQFEALSKRLRAEGIRVVGARPRVGAPDLSDLEKAHMLRNPTGLTGKQGRADPVASCLERGHQRRGECENTGGQWWGVDRHKETTQQRDGIRLFAGSWTQAYLDELEAFPDGGAVDMVDATSGAWAWLEAHAKGLSRAPGEPKAVKPSEIANVHPEDRGDDGERRGKDRAGRFTP